MTKYRKNEALIRNDGVYVISGIFCGAHGGRRLWRKQAEVSPVSNKSHKHALRAMWIDDCELWVKMHSRPGRWPLEAAKRLEARGHAQRASAAPEHRAAEGGTMRRCGMTMPNCGTGVLSRFNRPRRRVRRGRGDFCGGKSHFPEQKSLPCSFRARKSVGF